MAIDLICVILTMRNINAIVARNVLLDDYIAEHASKSTSSTNIKLWIAFSLLIVIVTGMHALSFTAERTFNV